MRHLLKRFQLSLAYLLSCDRPSFETVLEIGLKYGFKGIAFSLENYRQKQ